MELTRQQNDGEQRQQCHRQQRARHRLATEHGRGIESLQRLRKKRERTLEHPESDEHADADKGNELDDRLGGDRQHQSVLMLGGVDMARAEQDGEDRHRDRDVEGNIAQDRLHRFVRRSGLREDRGQRG